MNNKFYTNLNINYNNSKEHIEKKIDINKDYEYAFSDENIVEMYLDGKLKMKAEYNIIGLYNIPLSIWYWGWNIAFINKNLINATIKIKEFLNVINDNKEYSKFNKTEIEELHYVLSNDNFYISSTNIDKIIKLALYLTKGIWVFPMKYNDDKKQKEMEHMDKIEYILITKILQFN